MPLHQFTQSPVAIEVMDRNADPDGLVFSGPNIVAGYPHPTSGKVVSMDEHTAAMAKQAAEEKAREAHHGHHHH